MSQGSKIKVIGSEDLRESWLKEIKTIIEKNGGSL